MNQDKTQVLHFDVFLEESEIIVNAEPARPCHLIMSRGKKQDRLYYASLPPSKLIIWTFTGGTSPAKTPYGFYAKCLIGSSRLPNSSKLPGNENLGHLKITIIGPADSTENAVSLSALIANAPENKKYK